MAVTIDDILAAINRVYSGALAKTLLETSPAYQRLQAMGKVVTDARIEHRWPAVSKAYGGVTSIADGGTLPVSDQEEYDTAQLRYSINIGTVRVGRLLKMASSNKDEFFVEIQRQVDAAMRQLAREIHLQIVRDEKVRTTDLTGLGEAVRMNDNTYAGIARATNAFWQPYVNDNGGTNRPLSEALMTDVFDVLVQERGAQTGEIWSGTTAWNAAADLLGTTVRTSDPNNIRGGAQTINWKGLDIIKMPNMDTNTMDFLDFESDDGIQLKRQHEKDFITQNEATNSYDELVSIAGHYQLIVHNPFKQGCLKDVA